MVSLSSTAWKVSKHGVFSGPYFLVFGLEKTPYLDTFHAVQINPTAKECFQTQSKNNLTVNNNTYKDITLNQTQIYINKKASYIT